MDDAAFEVWDVFTDTLFAGNPLAIVETDGSLTTVQMQIVARQFNLSETIFLMPPRDPAHTERARIFFPNAETPFAGHPTVGAALYLAQRDDMATVVLEEEIGLVTVAVSGNLAKFSTPVLPQHVDAMLETTDCAAALGLDAADIGPHAPAIFAGGPTFLYLPLRTRGALTRAQPCQPAWDSLFGPLGLRSVWLYDPDLNARKFTATAEDPATGSAVAALAGQLLFNDALPEGTTVLSIRQGEDMGRPSRIGLEADVLSGNLTAIHISGQAVQVARGRIKIPA